MLTFRYNPLEEQQIDDIPWAEEEIKSQKSLMAVEDEMSEFLFEDEKAEFPSDYIQTRGTPSNNIEKTNSFVRPLEKGLTLEEDIRSR